MGQTAQTVERVRYLSWTEPDGSGVTTDYVFLLRDATGEVEVVHERHHTGLFSQDMWLGLLGDVGFAATPVEEVTVENRTPRVFLVGKRGHTSP